MKSSVFMIKETNIGFNRGFYECEITAEVGLKDLCEKNTESEISNLLKSWTDIDQYE